MKICLWFERFHKWDGCVCSRCGAPNDFLSPEQRYALDGTHDWNGCICRKCGQRALAKHIQLHDWDGCICRKCGAVALATQTRMHDWDGCICRKCGTKGIALEHGIHDWDKCKCRKCGEIDPSGEHEFPQGSCYCTRCHTDRHVGICYCNRCHTLLGHNYSDGQCRDCGSLDLSGIDTRGWHR